MLTHSNQQASAEREAYLAQISERLGGRLSPLEAYESIDELRAHINSMAAAHEELGLSPEQAMRASLEKFGPATQLGMGLADTASTRDCIAPADLIDFVTPASLAFSIATAWAACWIMMDLVNVGFFTLANGRPASFLDFHLAISYIPITMIGVVAWIFAGRLKPYALGITTALVMHLSGLHPLCAGVDSAGRPFAFEHSALRLAMAMYLVGWSTGYMAIFIRKLPYVCAPKRDMIRRRRARG